MILILITGHSHDNNIFFPARILLKHNPIECFMIFLRAHNRPSIIQIFRTTIEISMFRFISSKHEKVYIYREIQQVSLPNPTGFFVHSTFYLFIFLIFFVLVQCSPTTASSFTVSSCAL